MEETDRELIENTQHGNDKAFSELVRRYAPRVFLFLVSFVKNRGDAEDLSQDVFFKAWKHIKKFDLKRSFVVWLLVIAKNTAFDWLKKQKPFSASDIWTHEEWIVEMESIPDESPLPEELLEKKELAETFSKILENFDAIDRSIVSLRYQHNHTFEEIALILEKPMNTIKSRHRRALLVLREHLLHQKDLRNRTKE